MNFDEKSDDKFIAAGINKVFEHRKNYLVIGFTGRTGSGCSTAAQVLSTKIFSGLRLPTIKNPPIHHEDRKLRIVKIWAEKHWQPFVIVGVTALILALALEEGVESFIGIIKEMDEKHDVNELRLKLSDFEVKVKKAFSIARNVRDQSDDLSDITEAVWVLTEGSKEALSVVKSAFGVGSATYTKLFQKLGNNVRRSGSPTRGDIDSEKIFTIPETIEVTIRLIRRSFELSGVEQKYIAIDALRHPYEIRYLRERISSFYTVAVSTTEQERIRRLHSLQFTDTEVKDLDALEYPNAIAKSKDYSHLVKQNIQACLELADIYISNAGHGEESKQELSRQIVRYVALMQHPGLITPTAVERCMQVAIVAKVNSGCISRQVGAVVTDSSYSVKAIGWNDVPQGQVPCVLRNVSHLTQGNYDVDAYSEYESTTQKFKDTVVKTYGFNENIDNFEGRNLSYCFKSAYNKLENVDNQVHTRSLHAEENAFLQIAKYGGQSIFGGNLFTTASPCELCAKKAYQLGIKKIYYIDPYAGIATNHVLASGTAKPELNLFEGAIGKSYHDLYQPVMAYKDELPKLLAGARGSRDID
ncbi:hypothetical protein [Rhodoferax sp. WC2427]|uniref:hypothetical protein n=1 Tax=Rhodoferax sp. WC2427 TaxID=3234144 RepID=UPI003465B0D3